MAEVVVLVEVEVKTKMNKITSPNLQEAMVKMTKLKLLVVFQKGSLSAFIVSSKGLKGVDHWPNRCQLLTHGFERVP